jgi:hypothetical protein
MLAKNELLLYNKKVDGLRPTLSWEVSSLVLG